MIMADSTICHSELVLESQQIKKKMLKQVQHDGNQK